MTESIGLLWKVAVAMGVAPAMAIIHHYWNYKSKKLEVQHSKYAIKEKQYDVLTSLVDMRAEGFKKNEVKIRALISTLYMNERPSKELKWFIDTPGAFAHLLIYMKYTHFIEPSKSKKYLFQPRGKYESDTDFKATFNKLRWKAIGSWIVAWLLIFPFLLFWQALLTQQIGFVGVLCTFLVGLILLGSFMGSCLYALDYYRVFRCREIIKIRRPR
ncbi:hypothetical protein AAOGI_32350 [Agarivorans albus]